MAEIVVVARITATAGETKSVEAAVAELAQASRQEEGCLVYDMFVSPTQGAEFLVYEVWQNDVALTAHGQTKHIADFRAEVRGRAQISVQKLTRM